MVQRLIDDRLRPPKALVRPSLSLLPALDRDTPKGRPEAHVPRR